mmetsp:Transcript_26471/g.81800  ORF Transcript_26471/g.81800 Transcript_26471/m.81800 type:complete len:210 (-) Transcript_26471:480-1109(-)
MLGRCSGGSASKSRVCCSGPCAPSTTMFLTPLRLSIGMMCVNTGSPMALVDARWSMTKVVHFSGSCDSMYAVTASSLPMMSASRKCFASGISCPEQPTCVQRSRIIFQTLPYSVSRYATKSVGCRSAALMAALRPNVALETSTTSLGFAPMKLASLRVLYTSSGSSVRSTKARGCASMRSSKRRLTAMPCLSAPPKAPWFTKVHVGSRP